LHTLTKFVGHNLKVGDARNPLFTVSITHMLFPSQINITYIEKKNVVENNMFSRTNIFSIA